MSTIVFKPKTIIEPFRIHSVEPLKMTTQEQRRELIKNAGYNLFKLSSSDVMIDLLTDSGTGSMSKQQWAAIQNGDESYAGSPSYLRFHEAVTKLFPFKHILPTHQGRAAEKILFTTIGGQGKYIPNNTHFDTTRANIEYTGAEAFDFLIPEGKDPSCVYPFKGNMDITALEKFIDERGAENIPAIMITITNNTGGGQPVSLENMRFAENAWFIKQREDGQKDRDVIDIVQEISSLADGMTMSAKKDPMGNIGGWLAMNDDSLAERCRNLLILTEGFTTYGGLAGRDLEALAVGLEECVQHDYLEYRIKSTGYLGEALIKAGIPCIEPVGGSAVYIDARALLPHIPPLQYPGQALAIALYEIGGLRSCEIGTAMFGMQVDGSEKASAMDLVRLAIPRRTYTQSHVDYVIEVCIAIKDLAPKLTGYKIVDQPPALRHFTATFEPIDSSDASSKILPA